MERMFGKPCIDNGITGLAMLCVLHTDVTLHVYALTRLHPFLELRFLVFLEVSVGVS